MSEVYVHIYIFIYIYTYTNLTCLFLEEPYENRVLPTHKEISHLGSRSRLGGWVGGWVVGCVGECACGWVGEWVVCVCFVWHLAQFREPITFGLVCGWVSRWVGVHVRV